MAHEWHQTEKNIAVFSSLFPLRNIKTAAFAAVKQW
jgi:hypothetical protein